MSKARSPINKNIETAVSELLDSKAESRIYIYLLRKNRARSDDIIRGTKLHPSTVRELLSKMYENKLIFREKIQTDTIGKNPYLYGAISPSSVTAASCEDHRITIEYNSKPCWENQWEQVCANQNRTPREVNDEDSTLFSKSSRQTAKNGPAGLHGDHHPCWSAD